MARQPTGGGRGGSGGGRGGSVPTRDTGGGKDNRSTGGREQGSKPHSEQASKQGTRDPDPRPWESKTGDGGND